MNGLVVLQADKPQLLVRVHAPTEWPIPLTIITLTGLGWIPVFAWCIDNHAIGYGYSCGTS